MRTRELAANPSAEWLFLVGGEDMQPFYPQAGHDPEHDRQFPVAYVTGDASIDEMSFGGGFPPTGTEVLERRDEIAQRVRVNIINTEQIEADRLLLAAEFRKLVMRYTVDPEG